MGSDWGEFVRRILRFSWFGHQSLFDLIPTFVVPCTTGHLPAFPSVCVVMSTSARVPVVVKLLVWSLAGKRPIWVLCCLRPSGFAVCSSSLGYDGIGSIDPRRNMRPHWARVN